MAVGLPKGHKNVLLAPLRTLGVERVGHSPLRESLLQSQTVKGCLLHGVTDVADIHCSNTTSLIFWLKDSHMVKNSLSLYILDPVLSLSANTPQDTILN